MLIRSLCLSFAILVSLTIPQITAAQVRDITPEGSRPGAPKITLTPGGEIRLQGTSKPEEVAELRDQLGLPGGGYLGPEVMCGALMDLIPSGLLFGAADIGSIFGICPSSTEILEQAIKNYHARAKGICESFSGVQLSTVQGFKGLEIWKCEYKAPEIKPDCDEIETFCKKQAQPELWLIDRPGEASLVAGSVKFPGCSCTVARISWAELSLIPGFQSRAK